MPQEHFASSKLVSWGSTMSPGVCTAAFQLGVPQRVLVQGLVPSQVRDFALPRGELHEGPVSPFLQPLRAPLVGSTTRRRVSLSSHSCAACKLSEGTLCPISQVTACEQGSHSAAQGLQTCTSIWHNFSQKVQKFIQSIFLFYIQRFPFCFLQATKNCSNCLIFQLNVTSLHSAGVMCHTGSGCTLT